LILGAAILRSALATRLDGFALDEPYHIAAGVSYVRDGDFRLNPEHPPLVKLWVGSFISATGFRMPALRQFADKSDERNFAEEAVFLNNDFESVQRRARIAMWSLNGLLFIVLALAVRRVFGPAVALGTALFLAIDPTVAAHFPVVMTDLPVSLLSASAVVIATRAFCEWRWADLAVCSILLGLDLATKHSAPVFLIFLMLAGAALALAILPSNQKDSRRRLAKLCVVLAGALFILWSFYFFQFGESRAPGETFNRPLAAKIDDVNSPAYHFVLNAMTATHVVPRTYIWGFADTIRAGLEGRAISILAFGRPYYRTAPKYFFPGVIALKLPIGLGVLVLAGLFLFFARRLPRDWHMAATIVLAAAAFYLLVLLFGSSYGGVRHALPVIVLLAVVAAMPLHAALSSTSKVWKAVVALAFVAAAASAVPVMRPWEYFNEIIGGAKNGYLYFNDEGIDLSQRTNELTGYYREFLAPTGEIPFIGYNIDDPEIKARHLDFVGMNPERDNARMNSPVVSGTILVNAAQLGRALWWDMACLRSASPAGRFGNLVVFRGTYRCDSFFASLLYFDAEAQLYAETPDVAGAEKLLRQSLRLDPKPFFAHVELGNVCRKRGAREEALESYSAALQNAPDDRELRRSIQAQIKRVQSEPLEQIPDLKFPGQE
jgi:hypothetical protein